MVTTMKYITEINIENLSKEDLADMYVRMYNANVTKAEKLERYQKRIEVLKSDIDELIEELNDADDRFLSLRKAYKELKKSIEK